MANPQKENGSTMISNEVFEKIYSFPFTNGELRILLFIIRKTWGWNKKEDKISYNQIASATNITRRNAIYAVNTLVKKQALVIKKGYINTISFNKDYDLWVVPNPSLVKKPVLPSEETGTRVVPNLSLKLVPNLSPTKDNKDNIQNTLIQKKGKFIAPSLLEEDFIYISKYYSDLFNRDIPTSFVKNKYDDMLLWIEGNPSNPKLKGRDWKKTLMRFVKDDAIKIIERPHKGGVLDASNI